MAPVVHFQLTRAIFKQAEVQYTRCFDMQGCPLVLNKVQGTIVSISHQLIVLCYIGYSVQAHRLYANVQLPVGMIRLIRVLPALLPHPCNQRIQ